MLGGVMLGGDVYLGGSGGGERGVAGPALLDFDADVGVHAVDDARGDDAVDDGAGEEVGRGGPRQRHVLVAALHRWGVRDVP